MPERTKGIHKNSNKNDNKIKKSQRAINKHLTSVINNKVIKSTNAQLNIDTNAPTKLHDTAANTPIELSLQDLLMSKEKLLVMYKNKLQELLTNLNNTHDNDASNILKIELDFTRLKWEMLRNLISPEKTMETQVHLFNYDNKDSSDNEYLDPQEAIKYFKKKIDEHKSPPQKHLKLQHEEVDEKYKEG
ncbi:uncharacterized protein SCDLUD_004458 [Saccharomycodes ludwigii]|uniref:uncharacterized protein n=1 Tax=Saccharomycodes ludwigii TaxID=36035 RepID=UPI001E8B206E|nr:hypothetical protein SCDLUD_004458 [Saccharomycodes ludwigii]KAH3899036.1 hypothetical protein SCDLUD_004458 [Saccharomycodes ludwigii]